jgi:quercetin dioxygenase-like cupin family protein
MKKSIHYFMGMLVPVFILAGVVAGPAAYAQQPAPIKRTALQKIDFPGDKMTTALVLVEVIPDGLVARHTHPGVEMLYLLEGNVDLTIDGQPTKHLKPGDSAVTVEGVAHVGKAGPNGAKLIATYVVEKDKPIATPAK